MYLNVCKRPIAAVRPIIKGNTRLAPIRPVEGCADGAKLTSDRCAPFRTASSTGLRRAGELIILSVNVRYGERRPAAQGRTRTLNARNTAPSGYPIVGCHATRTILLLGC